MAELGKKAPQHVDVGILGEDAHGSGELSVAALAAIHEFGLGVPRRSFIADFVTENEDKLKRLIQSKVQAVAQRKKTRAQVLKELGAEIQGMIQARIANGIPPALAPSTIAQKGSSTPLIDTGQLRSSITHRVK